MIGYEGFEENRPCGDYDMDEWACLTMDAQTLMPLLIIQSHLNPKQIQEILRDL